MKTNETLLAKAQALLTLRRGTDRFIPAEVAAGLMVEWAEGRKVRDICVCWLPYQSHPFVVGTVDRPESGTGEGNVWLCEDGTWTETDGDPRIALVNADHWNPPAGKGRQWQPIETAPKDGTVVLLADKEHRSIGRYDETPSMNNYGPWRWGITVQPTHWLPLPQPPQTEGEGA